MTHHDWRDFYLVQDELRLATDGDVDALEASLNVQLPNGYRELVTTLGAGRVSRILRVFPPAALQDEQQLYREVTEEAWFFEEPDETLEREYALESIAIADSIDGDDHALGPPARRDRRTNRWPPRRLHLPRGLHLLPRA
ncbi:SMI1/KNR4 family protein [Kribbella qitaiheensis]|uniref:SMI1/KNR4 family protein n=1 Tax=Kribbella qitaiheensis TaxID=1544730 RepID=A0A7G6WVP9_9ACTN|nr:SMI1/KNR4 family protein [Kribbella qitaiheensis]QNE18064.1 SMI1/KNR4 family protein [Kribbella qitaiheensis]